MYQRVTKCTKWPQSKPNGHKIYQHLPWQDTPKLTQIGIFGLKINHLATLPCTDLRPVHLRQSQFAFFARPIRVTG
jgi:hypothetical protein